MHNESVAALVDRHPDRFIPFAGADIMRGSAAVAALERWVERGFRGLSLRSFMIDRPATDRAYFPFYAKCLELLRQMFRARHPSEHSHVGQLDPDPTQRSWTSRYIDEVACHFPDLTILVSHAGYPWVSEACLVAWKRAHVYLELEPTARNTSPLPGAGWEPLMRFGQATIADKVVSGTCAFLMNRPLLAAMRRNAYAANKT